MAQAKNVSKSTIHRARQDHGLKPYLSKTFTLSRDPKFLEKLTYVVGVYLTPPQNTVVLCVDEKSQIQALDRTQPRAAHSSPDVAAPTPMGSTRGSRSDLSARSDAQEHQFLQSADFLNCGTWVRAFSKSPSEGFDLGKKKARSFFRRTGP